MFDSLYSHAITVGSLIVWLGTFLGLGLLTLAQLLSVDDLARWGIAALCCSCTYSVHRQLATRDERLLQAFNMGRQHERQSSERSLTSL